MTFAEMLQDDLPIWFDETELAQAAVYRARKTMVDIPCTVLVWQGQDDELRSRGEAYFAGAGRLWCKRSEVIAPAAGDTFTLDGESWVVQQVNGVSRAAWELGVYRAAYAGSRR